MSKPLCFECQFCNITTCGSRCSKNRKATNLFNQACGSFKDNNINNMDEGVS